jgi:hypothetical protein
MRHILLAEAIVEGALGMLEAPNPTLLVALASHLQRDSASDLGTVSMTVNLATVTVATDDHLHTATCA